jgi:hypothetical protein
MLQSNKIATQRSKFKRDDSGIKEKRNGAKQTGGRGGGGGGGGPV